MSVRLQDQQGSVVADGAGQWQIKILGPLQSGCLFALTISGRNTIVVHDVLVGEVWVCSGQSNMEMPVPLARWLERGVLNYDQEITAAQYQMLRMFTVQHAIASKPQTDVNGSWVAAQGEAISSFSATAYFFGPGFAEGAERAGRLDSFLLGGHDRGSLDQPGNT